MRRRQGRWGPRIRQGFWLAVAWQTIFIETRSRRLLMFVRTARFEGGRIDDILAETNDIRADIEALNLGESSDRLPKELTDHIRRMEMFVDRQRGSVELLLYCDTEADAREIDRIMSGISPQRPGWGTRVWADVYEVLVDESVGRRLAA
jgi:hypothetical protein